MHNARKLRKLYGKTQMEIAEAIDYPKALYIAFEQGRIKIPKDKLVELSEFYNVSLRYLINGDEGCYR